MEQLNWNPTQLGGVFALPASVVRDHLKMAGSVQLKVLLWYAANGTFDAVACAKAIGSSAADCNDALQYWVEAGVLLRAGTPAPAPAPAAPAAPVAAPAAPKARPKAVKPQLTEVVAARAAHQEFGLLLDTLSARLGRPLSPGDMETMLYLWRDAGLPTEVILMAVGYATASDRFSVRYIEKIALDWADKGILTIDAAERHLCYLERCQEALLKVQTVCALPEPISACATNLSLAEKWIFTWRMGDDLLKKACEACVEKTGKFTPRYMDRVLENWKEQGVKTAEDLQPLSHKKTKKSAENGEYEQMVENYLPVYKKKKG